MYDALVAALKALSGMAFTEYEWATRPTGDFGTVQLDFDAAIDNGDDDKIDRAYEGSVDLFMHSNSRAKRLQVEAVLKSVCGNSWRLNSIQYESETGLLHLEWVFQLEVI